MTLIPLILVCGSISSAFTVEAGEGDVLLGVYIQEMDDKLREKCDFDGEGVYITGIIKGSGAEKSGIKAGDIIIMFNDKSVKTSKDLHKVINASKPGDSVDVVVLSDGKARTVTVTMSASDQSGDEGKVTTSDREGYYAQLWKYQQIKPYLDIVGTIGGDDSGQLKYLSVYDTKRAYMGVSLVDLTKQLARFFRVKGGVLVSMVVADSPAGSAGLKAGDVIIEWNGDRISKSNEIFNRLEKAKQGDNVELSFARKGEKRGTVVKLGKLAVSGKMPKSYKQLGTQDYYAPTFQFPPPVKGKDLKAPLDEYKKEIEKLRAEMKQFQYEIKKMIKEMK